MVFFRVILRYFHVTYLFTKLPVREVTIFRKALKGIYCFLQQKNISKRIIS